MIYSNLKITLRRFALISFMLLFAGWMLGSLHKYQWVLFSLLVVIAYLRIQRKYRNNKRDAICTFTGFILTTVLGTSCELWGTYNHYWTYHDIPSYQLIPVWIPIAWGFTYFAFHLFEKCLCQFIKSDKLSLLTIASVSLILPTVGEYIPIYMGVWTYHWPYQFIGVPLLASLGIWAVHIVVFIIMCKLNKKYLFNNKIYNVWDSLFKQKLNTS